MTESSEESVRPSREDVARAIDPDAWDFPEECASDIEFALGAADRILALFATQPTMAEVKAEPQRVQPSHKQAAQAVANIGAHYAQFADFVTDAILALFAAQPTEAEVRAQLIQQIGQGLRDLPTARTQAWGEGWDSVPLDAALGVIREVCSSSGLADNAAVELTDRRWVPGRWWRVLAPDGSLWCESSDERENRNAFLEAEEESAGGYSLERLFVSTEQEWRKVQ